ncbi:MAG: hypothetical protein ABIO83_07930 [Ilumatobacteraceae bacterium]
MTASTTYEIVIRGRATARILRPLLDDFAIDHSVEGITRLTGDVRDPAHLHGIVARLSAVNAELISIGPLAPATPPPTNRTATTNNTRNQP